MLRTKGTILVINSKSNDGKKCGCLWRRGKVVCWIMMRWQNVRQWERRHLYSKGALTVPLHSILKRWICCCYLYLWIHAIWPSVRWWVIPMQHEELVVNLQSATSASYLTCYSTPGSAEYGWRWSEVEERKVRGGDTVSHLRTCGTGSGGVQEHG